MFQTSDMRQGGIAHRRNRRRTVRLCRPPTSEQLSGDCDHTSRQFAHQDLWKSMSDWDSARHKSISTRTVWQSQLFFQRYVLQNCQNLHERCSAIHPDATSEIGIPRVRWVLQLEWSSTDCARAPLRDTYFHKLG